MEARAKLFGHAIHQMLIPFPLGLLATGVVFDIIYLVSGNSWMAMVAFYMIAAGIVGAVIAAPFGFIDFLGIPKGTRAKSVGAMHGLGNLVVAVLFVASWYLRYNDAAPYHLPTNMALVFSFLGALLSGLTAWLGGELVD